jgi:hypothetical protein
MSYASYIYDGSHFNWYFDAMFYWILNSIGTTILTADHADLGVYRSIGECVTQQSHLLIWFRLRNWFKIQKFKIASQSIVFEELRPVTLILEMYVFGNLRTFIVMGLACKLMSIGDI